MITDTSHSNHLFPLSKRCCAVDPVLQQIRSKHSDRCIHKNGSQGPGVRCNAALNYLSTEQPVPIAFYTSTMSPSGWSGTENVAGNKMRRHEANTQRLWAQTIFGCDNGWADAKAQKRCPKTVLSNVLQDRPFGVVPYFKYIVLKCGKVSHLKHSYRQANAHKCKKIDMSISEWLLY